VPVPSVALAPPDDDLLRLLIVKLAADRQINVDEALVNYLANRIERSFTAAHAGGRALGRGGRCASIRPGDACAGGGAVPLSA